MKGTQLVSIGKALICAALFVGCAGDPVGPQNTAAVATPELSVSGAERSAFITGLSLSSTSTQTSPWYKGWTTVGSDSVGNNFQYVGVRPSTAVPVKATITYLNGVVRERRTHLWEPAMGGWELVRVTSTFYNPDGTIYATQIKTPDELGLTSFLSSTCVTSFVRSLGSCTSGVLQGVGGFVILVATAPVVAAGAPPTLGATAVAWLASWAVWTGVLIDAVESCSGGGGSAANERPKKRLT